MQDGVRCALRMVIFDKIARPINIISISIIISIIIIIIITVIIIIITIVQ